jgi:hypothetical protein
MSFGAVGVAAGIIALEPAFATGTATGVALLAFGLAISFFAAEQWGLLGIAITIIGALLLAGGVIGLAEADFAGLAFSALLHADCNRALDHARVLRAPCGCRLRCLATRRASFAQQMAFYGSHDREEGQSRLDDGLFRTSEKPS